MREVVDAFSARFAGRPGWETDGASHPSEAQALPLASDLAVQALGWRPRLDIHDSLGWTADWYGAYTAGENMLNYTESQLARYRRP